MAIEISDELRNSGIVDMKKINALLNSDITDYRIEQETGVSRMAIGNFRKGVSDIAKMPVYNGVKLTKYAISQNF